MTTVGRVTFHRAPAPAGELPPLTWVLLLLAAGLILAAIAVDAGARQERLSHARAEAIE